MSGVIFKTEKRRIIPRWRSLEHASMTGELKLVPTEKRIFSLNSMGFLEEQIASWKKNKSLSYAGDLLSSAYVLGLEQEFSDVAKFILENNSVQSDPLFQIAKKIALPEEALTRTDLSSRVNNIESYSNEIKKYKYYLRGEPRNAIAQVELGRLYSLMGQFKKAQLSIDRALMIDPNSRFIVRSASRFYHHFHGDKDIALKIVKNSSNLKTDPWLLSAEIAYSTVLERFSRMVKVGLNYLDNKNVDHFSTSELSSAIATVEHFNGKNRNARNFFRQSLIKPNDNSLAQAEWMAEDVGDISIDEGKLTIPLAFEARAVSSYNNNNFKGSFENAILWSTDEPYSVRPYLLASYIAGSVQGDNKVALEVLNKSLEFKINDARIWNNLIYYFIEDNKIEEAIDVYQNKLQKNSVDTSDLNQEEKITLTATIGLIYYRTGRQEDGAIKYYEAIDTARKLRNDYILTLALLNFAREEILCNKNRMLINELMTQVDIFCKNRKEIDIVRLESKVKELYKRIT